MSEWRRASVVPFSLCSPSLLLCQTSVGQAFSPPPWAASAGDHTAMMCLLHQKATWIHLSSNYPEHHSHQTWAEAPSTVRKCEYPLDTGAQEERD